MILRAQLLRYSPLTAIFLVFLAACNGDSASSASSSGGSGASTSARLGSDAVSNTDEVAPNPDGATPPPAVASTVESGRPVLERRLDSSGAVADDTDSGTGADGASAEHSDGDDDPAEHSGDDVDAVEHSDDDAPGPVDGDQNSAAADVGTAAEDDAEDDEPQLSARERMLAWLAEDSVLESFPSPTAQTGGGGSVPRLVRPEEPLEFVRPAAVKGVYLNAWAAGSSRRSQALIDLAARTEVNTFVIDIKDATGYVSYATEVMTAREVGADQEIRIRDLVGLLGRLHEAGIYPIARIVIVKDPLLIRARPEWAAQDTAGGVWVDSKGLVWANLHDQRVWDYHVDLAKEAAAVGFPEIQWDYVRFADAPQADLDRAVFPGADGRLRRDAVEAFLEYSRAELEDSGVATTVDVFGATTSARTDVGIGQYWERFIGSVDVALPMVYPSHYWTGSFGIQDPNAYPYEVVRQALEAGLERSRAVEGAGMTRPWLQDFTLGAPRYEAPEVRAQIEATYDAGIDEWVLWNPSSRYTESALEPADGYPVGVEPMMRVGGKIVRVSERHDVLREAAEARALARAVADSIQAARAAAAVDSLAAVTGDPEPVAGVRR